MAEAEHRPFSNGVRILTRRGQKVRGLRHIQHRPKLIVVDDPEDGEWVRTKENRDKTDRWLNSEMAPCRGNEAEVLYREWLDADACWGWGGSAGPTATGSSARNGWTGRGAKQILREAGGVTTTDPSKRCHGGDLCWQGVTPIDQNQLRRSRTASQ